MSSCNTTISLNSSEKSPLLKKDALGGSAVEKEKQVVHATIDVDSCESIVTINAKGVWVQLRRNTLTMEDKCIIEGGHRLTDKHINFAKLFNFSSIPSDWWTSNNSAPNQILLFSFTEHSSYFLQEA